MHVGSKLTIRNEHDYPEQLHLAMLQIEEIEQGIRCGGGAGFCGYYHSRQPNNVTSYLTAFINVILQHNAFRCLHNISVYVIYA